MGNAVGLKEMLGLKADQSVKNLEATCFDMKYNTSGNFDPSL